MEFYIQDYGVSLEIIIYCKRDKHSLTYENEYTKNINLISKESSQIHISVVIFSLRSFYVRYQNMRLNINSHNSEICYVIFHVQEIIALIFFQLNWKLK